MQNFIIEQNWRWNYCKLPIKRLPKAQKKLDEQYYYQVINYEIPQSSKQQNISITLDKNFDFQPHTGFVWHKSRNIPQITVQMCHKIGSQVPKNCQQLWCQVMAVYPIKYQNSYYLHEVSLQGQSKKQLKQGKTTLKYLKFNQTSFNHSRSKFCLLIWIYQQHSIYQYDDLTCMISSPIYVDSRKQARKKQISVNNSNILISPLIFYTPLGSTKSFINNSLQGFFNYYSAQNIRNKIKHPFYIAYHFDLLFKLYLNIQLKLQLTQILNIIQYKPIFENGIKNQQQNILMIQILQQDEKYYKKIINIIEKWKFRLIQYRCSNHYQLQSKWNVISKQSIKSSYQAYYDQQIKKQQEEHHHHLSHFNYHGSYQKNGQELFNKFRLNYHDKNDGESDDKSNQGAQKQRKYELRTIIELSKPRKKTRQISLNLKNISKTT